MQRRCGPTRQIAFSIFGLGAVLLLLTGCVDHSISGASPVSVLPTDLDGDGTTDLVSANGGTGDLSVLIGKRDGTFVCKQRLECGLLGGISALALGDLDNDGKSDAVPVGELYDMIPVLRGQPGGRLSAPEAVVGSRGSTVNPMNRLGRNGVTVADLSADDLPDIATGNRAKNSVSVLLRHPGERSPETRRYPAGRGPVSIAEGDFDGDSRGDLATANAHGGNVSVLLGDGKGTFQAEKRYDAGTEPTSLAVADLDADGALDLVTTNQGGDVSVLSRRKRISLTYSSVPRRKPASALAPMRREADVRARATSAHAGVWRRRGLQTGRIRRQSKEAPPPCFGV